MIILLIALIIGVLVFAFQWLFALPNKNTESSELTLPQQAANKLSGKKL